MWFLSFVLRLVSRTTIIAYTEPVKRAWRTGVGIGLILLGIPGLVLPFLQGVLMIAAGLALVSSGSPTFRRTMRRLRARYSVLDRWIVRWRERVRSSGWSDPAPREGEPDQDL